MERILAVDFGEKRVGIAVSDPTGLIARSWGIVQRTSNEQVAERVAQIAGELEAGTIVLGLPFDMQGEEGYQARRVRRFVAVLAEKVSIPIVFCDESLTSADAEAIVRERGERRSRRSRPVDAIAAAVLLQSYLDRPPLTPGRSPEGSGKSGQGGR
jgi:putative holliday junction resolvase